MALDRSSITSVAVGSRPYEPWVAASSSEHPRRDRCRVRYR